MKKTLVAFLLLAPMFTLATPVSWDKSGSVLQPLPTSYSDEVKVPYVTSTTTTATSTFPRLSITTSISILGEYFTNFTTYVRSLFTGGKGITITAGEVAIDEAVSPNWSGIHTFAMPPVSTENASTSTQVPNWGQVSAISQGLVVRESVKVATVGAISTSTEQTIDGVGVVTGDRVLVKDQAQAWRNGIYVVAEGDWARATDYDESDEVQEGTFMAVLEGTVNATKIFVQYEIDPVINVDSLNFTELSSAVNYEAENGISESSNTFSLGGTLNQNTSINQANYLFDFNLNGNGDFRVTDAGDPVLTVDDSGKTTITNLVANWLSATTSLDYWFNASTTIKLVDLASDLVSGILSIAKGGTGLSTTPENGELLIGNGTGYTQTTLTAGDNINITNGAGSITIASLGGGGSTATSTFGNTKMLPWVANGSSYSTWTDMSPDASDFLSASTTKVATAYYKRYDLNNAYRFRTVRNLSVAGSTGSYIYLEYSYDRTNWNRAGTDDDCTLVGTGNVPCPWATLATGARTDVYLRYRGDDGNGATDPRFYNLVTEFTTYASTEDESATTTDMIAFVTSPTTNQAWANMPLAKSGTYYNGFGSVYHYQTANLYNANNYRISATIATTTNVNYDPISTMRIDVQYSYDKTTWYNLNSGTVSPATGTGELDISQNVNTVNVGSWASIAEGAKGNVYLRFVGYGGNGVKDIYFRNLEVQIDGDLEGDVTLVDNWEIVDGALTPTTTIPISVLGASSTNATTTNLVINGLTGLLKATNGVVSTATAITDYLTDAIWGSDNTWTGHNIFSSLFATNASSTNATTTNFSATNATITTLNSTNILNSGTATTSKLCFASGACMTEPSPVGSMVTFYPHNDSADIVGYEDMFTYPDGTTPVDESCTADSDVNGGYCTIDTYISTTTDISIINYPAGTTRIFVNNYVNSATGDSRVVLEGYKRTAGGVETFLGQATTTEINNLTVAEVLATFTGSEDFAFNSDGTDRLVLKVLGYTTSNVGKEIHWTYQNTGNYSRMETPITFTDTTYAKTDKNETITGSWTFSNLLTSVNNLFTNATTTNLAITSLATPAGSLLAVDPNGLVIATTTPSGGTGASTTLLADSNTFTGSNTFATSTFSIGSIALSITQKILTGLSDLPIALISGLSTVGEQTLNVVGINNQLAIVEDSSANADPSILFAPNDYMTTSDSATIEYATSTDYLKFVDATAYDFDSTIKGTILEVATATLSAYFSLGTTILEPTRIQASSTLFSTSTISEYLSVGETEIDNNFTQTTDFSSDLQDAVRSMDINKNFLYIITYGSTTESTFKMFDLTDPTRPSSTFSGVLTGLPDLRGVSGGGGKGLDIRGEYAYVTYDTPTSTDALRIIDVRDKNNPVVVGGEDLPFADSRCQSLSANRDNIFMVCNNALETEAVMYVVDIRDKTTPSIVSTSTLDIPIPWRIKIQDNYAYIIGRNGTATQGFRIYDISDPSSPVEVGGDALDIGEGGWALEVIENYAYLAAGGSFTTSEDDKLVILDVSNKTNPVKVGGLKLTDDASSYIRVYGKYAYLTSWSGVLSIVDISSSTNPTLIQTESVNSYSLASAVYDNYIYVGFAPVPRNGIYAKIYRLNGVNSPTGVFGSLTAGIASVKDMFVSNLLQVKKLIVGAGGLILNNDGGSLLSFGNKNLTGSQMLSVPFISGVASTTIGTLYTVGLNNQLSIIEDSTLNTNPSLSFISADFADTFNSGSITFSTSTDTMTFSSSYFVFDDDGSGTTTVTYGDEERPYCGKYMASDGSTWVYKYYTSAGTEVLSLSSCE